MANQDPWVQAAAAYKGGAGTQNAPAAQAEDWRLWGQNDNDPGASPAHFRSSAGDMISTPFEHIGRMFSGPYHAFTDPATDAEKQEFGGQDLSGAGAHLSLGMKRMFVDPTVQSGKRAIENYHAGKYGDMANDVMDALPVVGPWARSISNETAQKGAVAGLEGLATDAFAPKMMMKGTGAMLRGGGMLARGLAATPETRALATTRMVVPGEPAQLLSRALKPSILHPDFEQSAQASIPSILKENPQPGIMGFRDAAERAKNKVAQEYEDLKAPVRNHPMDTTPMVQPQVDSIPAMNRFETPGIIDATRRTASAYDMTPSTRTVTSSILDPQGKPFMRNETIAPVKPTLETVDSIRKDANAKLNAFYQKTGGDRYAARSNPETARTEAVGNGARDLVYGKLADASGVPEEDIRENQNLFGHLSDVRDVAGKRATVFGRQNPLSLQETLAATPGHPVSGIMDFAGQRLLKKATGSDALVNSALDRFQNPNETPLFPRKGFAPKILMYAGNIAKEAGGRIPKIRVAGNPGNQRDQ